MDTFNADLEFRHPELALVKTAAYSAPSVADLAAAGFSARDKVAKLLDPTACVVKAARAVHVYLHARVR